VIAAAEVTMRAGAMEAAAWVREEVTGAAAWVRVGAMESAAWVREEVTGAAAWVRVGAMESAAWVKEAAMGAAALATEQTREVAELQIRRLVTRLLSGLTWSQLTSATPRGSWPGSRYATPRAPTWSLFLRSNVARADTTGSQISKKHDHRGGRWLESTAVNHSLTPQPQRRVSCCATWFQPPATPPASHSDMRSASRELTGRQVVRVHHGEPL
jgi:hypothetical protein